MLQTRSASNQNDDPRGQKERTMPKYPKPTEPEPSEEQLQEWVLDSICEATDGCTVEPDGTCEHGHVSWLIYLGLM